jgi:hypothetical protein
VGTNRESSVGVLFAVTQPTCWANRPNRSYSSHLEAILKRLTTGALALLMAAGFGASAVIAAPTSYVQGNNGNSARQSGVMLAQASAPESATALPPADFGNPPSGEVPILFNDHHVYSRPATLRAGRVLTALVRGDSVLVPLRSLFEQTGGTVSYDPSTKTVDVAKPGSDVKVTVGRPEVVINGESRPLDVPPEIYRGTVVVPLRVLAEGMGAYVQWIPDRKVVVVRYVTATPPPPPPVTEPSPVPVPSVSPMMSPTPEPTTKKVSYERYVIGDYLFKPKVYDEFNNGSTGGSTASFGIKGAIEFPILNLPWMLEGDYRNERFPAGNAGTGTPSVFLPPGVGFNYPSFTVRSHDFDGRFGLKVADPRIYVGVGYLYRSSNEPYPSIRGLGFGIEKLPDLDQQLSIYGSAYYYPSTRSHGTYLDPSPGGANYTIAYRILRYSIGGTYAPMKGPIFLDFGWEGERGNVKQNAISSYTTNGPFVGLGIHF